MRFEPRGFRSSALVLVGAVLTASACGTPNSSGDGGSNNGGRSGTGTTTGGSTAAGHGGTGAGGGASGAAGMTASGGSGGTTNTGGTGGAGGSGGTSGTTSTGGAGGAGAAGGAGGSAGAVTGGSGGSGSGGAPLGGMGGAGATNGGMGGAAMSQAGAGGTAQGWVCPDPSTFSGSPIPSGATAARISGAPPMDSFNMNSFTNVEGPVWIGGALYFSEMQNGNNPPPPARILKIDASNQISVFINDSGSNGLAVDGNDNLIAAEHGVGGIVSYDLSTKAATTLVGQYMGKRFNSPNDLTLKKDGTIFFTDPDFQNSARPQGATRAYQVAPGTNTATAIAPDYSSNPNGITLSLDEQSLFIGGGMGVKKYTIDSTGAVASSGTAFGTSLNMNTDGMVEDCAGNLYVAVASSTNIVVVDSTGKPVAGSPIQVSGPSAVTNVAFGGADHKTLYITGQGSSGQQGVFKMTLNFPGMPY